MDTSQSQAVRVGNYYAEDQEEVLRYIAEVGTLADQADSFHGYGGVRCRYYTLVLYAISVEIYLSTVQITYDSFTRVVEAVTVGICLNLTVSSSRILEVTLCAVVSFLCR